MDGSERTDAHAGALLTPLAAAPVTQLPDRVAVGGGTALFLDGRCSHPDDAIAAMRVTVDGNEQAVAAHAMPLADRVDGADYWWALVPLAPVDERHTAPVSLRARLAGGGEAETALGAIELLPSVDAEPQQAPASARATREPLIAIAMAAYEPPLDLFRRQVDSIRVQTHHNWVCVISDDSSSPQRRAEMASVIGDDPRFILSPAPARLGVYHNFERALALAPREAEYVAFADQDDRWYPDKLRELLSRLRGEVKLAYSDMRVVDQDGKTISETYWSYRRNNHTNFGSLLVANTITGAASLFRRDVLDHALPFPPRHGDIYHDHWVALVAMALGEVSYVDRPLYEYVQHAGAALGHAEANAGHRRLRERGRQVRILLGGLRRWELHPRLRELYLEHYLRTELMARALEVRCGDRMPPARRRVLRTFGDSARGVAWLAARATRSFYGATETLDRERVLLGALLWRRLAPLVSAQASRRRPVAAPPVPGGHNGSLPRQAGRNGSTAGPEPGPEWLTPLLVDYFSRDGSTLMMRLLATSPEIALEPVYPFERKYFAYLWRWSRLIDRGEAPRDGWGANAFGSLTQERLTPLMGPPPWHPRPLIESEAGEPSMAQRCFELAWGEFSRRAARAAANGRRNGGRPVRLYAEKHLNTWLLDLDRLPPVKVIPLLRDPRDTYVSIMSFNALRGTAALGRDRAGSDREHLEHILTRQRERLRWIAGLLDRGDAPVIRYEDMVRDLHGVAGVLERWLGVPLDPQEALDDRKVLKLHSSASSPVGSIGRWRDELDPAIAEVFSRELGPELRAVGLEI